MDDGLCAVNISSLNPDSMEEEQTRRDIIKILARSKVNIAAIQETHIIQDRDYLLGNYRSTTSLSAKKEDTVEAHGRTSIMLHGGMQQ